MLKIGDFSRLSRITVRMQRHYDEIGLLPPVHIDPDTLYRYYDARQLITAARIAALRDMGFGLSEIGELMRATKMLSTMLYIDCTIIEIMIGTDMDRISPGTGATPILFSCFI